jgi:hypothetical protein
MLMEKGSDMVQFDEYFFTFCACSMFLIHLLKLLLLHEGLALIIQVFCNTLEKCCFMSNFWQLNGMTKISFSFCWMLR